MSHHTKAGHPPLPSLSQQEQPMLTKPGDILSTLDLGQKAERHKTEGISDAELLIV